MPEIRRHWLAEKVWVPLRAVQQINETGKYGYLGYQAEFYGVGTLAVPVSMRESAERLDWMDVGISHNHSGWVDDDDVYHPVDTYIDYRGEVEGVHLVLDQTFNSQEPPEWHLHQDLVSTLGLKREGDIWVRPDEGYEICARLLRNSESRPILIEIRASLLGDYLCARRMALYASSYRSRTQVADNVDHISWDSAPLEERTDRDRWEGGVYEIHEGGALFGGGIFVMHSEWTDEFTEGDVPKLGQPTDANITSRSWTTEDHGRKLYRVDGELWRTEWIEPASSSPIVREDDTPPIAFFIVDTKGTRQGKDELESVNGWLWFRPDVISALAHRRGGGLKWYTRDTGQVSCSPDYGVHFGVNDLGLVNVFAKDIGMLPDWQQQVWAGYNIAPDGGVSSELLAAQVKARPADTQAPEGYLVDGLRLLQQSCVKGLGFPLLREHDTIPELIPRAHRFRATSREGLFALAKDLARMTADSIDVGALNKVVEPPKGQGWGSLKSLEKVLATVIGDEAAHVVMGPLVGVYELRLGDAHLPSGDIDDAMALLRIDQRAPLVTQGAQLMMAFVGTLFAISKALSLFEHEGA